MLDSRCRDLEVQRAPFDPFARPTQGMPDRGAAAGHSSGKRQDGDPSEEGVQGRFRRLRICASENSFVDLHVGDNADRNALSGEAFKQVNRCGVPSKGVDHPIAIEQIWYYWAGRPWLSCSRAP